MSEETAEVKQQARKICDELHGCASRIETMDADTCRLMIDVLDYLCMRLQLRLTVLTLAQQQPAAPGVH